MKFFLLMATISFLFSGCLKTRNEVKDVEQKQVLQQQVVSLQKNTADTGNRFSDLEEQMRYLNGRVENIENKINRTDSDVDRKQKVQNDSLQDVNRKMQIYQEALTKLEAQIIQLQNELAHAKAEASAKEAQESSQKAKAASAAAAKNPYDLAQDLFAQKDWKAAIIEYQKYRDQSPKGKNFADATYKIGVCFQELGMKEDAKSFYQEAISRFPNGDEARRSKVRLKSLK